VPYDLFISYAHLDNKNHQVRELHQVRDLRDEIERDFKEFAGRELHVFFDEQDISSMDDWEKKIGKGLRESRLFLAVISPNYFKSKWCRIEWEEYIRYEAMRQCLGEGVAPVYFIELPGFFDENEIKGRISEWADDVRKRQLCDLASQEPVEIERWHEVGKRALKDAEVARRLHTLKTQLTERLSRADRAKLSPTNFHQHNRKFVGRIRELTLLREAMTKGGRVGVVGYSESKTERDESGAITVHGLGGMGKTELALAYGHAFAWDYPGGRWQVACEHLSDFNMVLHKLAEPMGVEFTDEQKKDYNLAAERILRELKNREPSLLLLDNVDDPALLSPNQLMRLPQQGHVHVLATTRMGPMQIPGSSHEHSFIAVDELPPDDALALIRSHQPDARFKNEDDRAAAQELVKLLDGFTLAVETAAIYLERHYSPGIIADYTSRLRAEYKENLKRLNIKWSEDAAGNPVIGVRHGEALLGPTLEITFKTLSHEEMHVLTLGALLPADQIALPWVRAVACKEVPAFDAEHSGGDGDGVWTTTRDALLSLRFFLKDEKGRKNEHVVRMHRMVQELIRQREKDSVEGFEQSLIEHVKSRADFLWEGWVDREYRWEVTPLAACAWHWIEGEGVGPYLANQAFGPLKELARYSEAEPLVRRALSINEASFGPDHPKVATDLNNLAGLLQATSRLDEAEPLMRRALSINEASFSPNHPNITTTLNNLAQLFYQTNRLEEAEPMFRQTINIIENYYGKDHTSIAFLLNNLAELLHATNRLDEAEQMFRRVIDISEKCCGKDHPKVANVLNNLAELFRATNRMNEAEPMYRRVIEIFEKCYGKNHPEVALALNNLAELLRATNRLDEAEPMLWRALKINKECFGPDHPKLATTLINIALLLQTMNRLNEADLKFRQVIEIFEKCYGKDHPKVATTINNLAALLQVMNRLDEAESMYKRALSIDEASYGLDHPSVAIRLNNLAELFRATNRMNEAEPMYRRVIEILEKSYGNNHPNLATALNNLALLLGATSRLEQAEPMYRRALAIDETSFGPDHPNVAIRLNNLAELLRAMSRLEEAESMYRRAYSINEVSFGPDHPNVARDLNNFALLLEGMNRLDEAEPLYRRALAIVEASFGPDHSDVARYLNNLAALLYATNRLDDAEPLYRRALAIDEASYGPDHPSVAIRLNNLAELLRATNRQDEAEPLMRRHIGILLNFIRRTGHQHPHIQGALGNYAGLLQAMGKTEVDIHLTINNLLGEYGMEFGD